MARKITVALEDDLDGGPADETVRFALGSTGYEIDLSAKNATAFRKQLAPFTEHARRSCPGTEPPGRAHHLNPRTHRGHPGVGERGGHHSQRPRAHPRQRGRAVRRSPRIVTKVKLLHGSQNHRQMTPGPDTNNTTCRPPPLQMRNHTRI